MNYDVIVIGLGGMGSATFYQLASRGLKVLGLERFDIPHTMGSSHGLTRIIRLAYYEHPQYVPLLRRSYELWRSLEREAGRTVFHQTGSVDVSAEDDSVFAGSLASCLEHDLPHEVLTSRELTARFPGYRLPERMKAVFQPQGGFLEPEASIVSFVTLGMAAGGVARARERVLAWEPRGDGVVVTTDRGEYRAGQLVIAGGAWASSLVPALAELAVPERQVLIWLQPTRPGLFAPERFPVFNCAVEEGDFYGFPVFAIPGFKFGRYHHLEERVDPETVDRECHPRDEAILRRFAERYFPEGAGATMSMKACMFTNTPDLHFVIDRLPDCPQVCVAAGFSGHGFKFCSVVGEILADLAIRGETGHEIGMFRLARFA
ncbi:MAG: N-methyl-L-tryptophan oxidase [Gemmatimonadales bacterium]